MKKFSLIVLVMLIPFVALAASYGDNQYQKLAEAYTVRAQDAFDSGEYDLAVEYTIKAEENAELSRQYVEMMLLRSEADTQIRVARNRLVWARSIKADENFPEMYNESMSLVEQAQVAFSGEKYEEAKKQVHQIRERRHPCWRAFGRFWFFFLCHYMSPPALSPPNAARAAGAKKDFSFSSITRGFSPA